MFVSGFKNMLLLIVGSELFSFSQSFHHAVFRDKVITKGIFETFNGFDWFNCVKECANKERCVSYNYGIGKKQSTMCQLSMCGINERALCQEKLLLHSQGFVFQQLKGDLDGTMCGSATEKPSIKNPKDCREVYQLGNTKSGIFAIDPDGRALFPVYCDQVTRGGGWTMFQKRLGDSLRFYRRWQDYTEGFGELGNEFWLGLDRIHRLTNGRSVDLRIELENDKGDTTYAEYRNFRLSSRLEFFKLHVEFTGGTARDSLALHHNGHPFSTYDGDHDNCSCSCAERFKGAWWFDGTGEACLNSNLNGAVMKWSTWNYKLKRSEMKLRPV